MPCIFMFTACQNIDYTVKFIVDGNVYAEVPAVSDEPINMPEDPIKVGYTFKGWFMSNELQSETFSDLAVTRNLTVYALFTPNTYYVTLDANGGECDISNFEVVFDTNFSLPTPTRAGYEFKGWYAEDVLVDSEIWVYDTELLTAEWKFVNNVVDDNVFTLNVDLQGWVPGGIVEINPVYIQNEATVESYIFVKVECDEPVLDFISLSTPHFSKYNDSYYYIKTSEPMVLFVNALGINTNVANEFQNIDEINLSFTCCQIQSAFISSVDEAYAILMGI